MVVVERQPQWLQALDKLDTSFVEDDVAVGAVGTLISTWVQHRMPGSRCPLECNIVHS